ncbi:MAG: phage tail tape measure protein [Clostridiales bacterium]|nr:phage tail tape measure protein [Clostridiales bacterium]
MSEADNLSAEAKDALRSAAEDAAEALRQLSQAQEQADSAMQQYNETLQSGTENLGALEAAASRANEAAENLAAANATASEAAETLSQATGEASKAAQGAGNSGTSAVESIAGALASAGIVASVHKISEEVYELADAFSDAESTVVLATGAAGDALDSLTDSMMSAYSAAKYGDLSETAAAVGEINTRLGYTGELLSETTELYLDYAAVTGGSASSSVRSLTQLMNQWNIEAAETESVMDKLSYAGQAAGISVTTLTSDLINNKPILDQLNFSLDESIAMFSRFELYGTNASSVMTGFRTALSSGAISSLEDLYDVFEQISSGAMDAAAASDIFGSRAGTTIVDAVRQGVFEMDSFVEALETSGGVMEATAKTAQTLSQQWEQANQKVSASFTNALEPTISDASSALAGLWGQVGDFLGEHETATKVIASMGAGIGSVASAFGLYTAAVKIAQPITALFGTTLSAAIWPLTAAAAAIAALSAAVLILRDNYKTVYNEAVSMSASTREQTERLEALQTEYGEVAATQGAESDAALRLRYQIDDLTAYLDENGQSVAELSDEIQSAVKQHDDLTQSYKDSMGAIDAESVSIASLAAKLKGMASAGGLTASSLEGMQSIIDTLNLKVDGLDLTIPDAVQDPNAVADYINQMLQQQAEQQKTEQSWQRYIDLLSEKDTDMDAFAKAGAELRAAQSQYDEAASAFDGKVYTADSLLGHITTTGAIYQAASDTFDTATENFESARIALEETDAELESLEKQLGITKEAVEDYGKSVPSASEIANLAIQSTQDEITALCQAYEDAYEAALDSFEGQFGLFDQAQSSAEATVYSAQAALNSQLTYWTNYTANLETLRDYGETLTGEAAENYNALISYVQSGDEEAAGLAANIAAYISQGRYEAVEQLAETNAQVTEMQQTAAATIGEWQTDFDAQLEQITQSMDDFIGSLSGDQYTEDAKTAAKQIVEGYTSTFAGGISDYIDQYNSDMEAFQSDVEDYVDDLVTELDFGDEAKSAAQSAISEYIQAITDSEEEAVSTATALAAAVANALGAAGSVNVSTEAAGTTTGYATGTTNAAEDVFIAGENGPELIIGKKGSKVFPASETERIIAAVNGNDSAPAPAGGDTYYNAGDTNSVSTNYDYGRSVDETFNSYQTTNNYTAAAEPEQANTESTIADGFISLSETLQNLAGKFTYESQDAPYDEISALPAYASGTTDSAENFIAGENGPELIIGQPDSTIFPADETARLMNVLSDSEITAALPDDSRWHRELMGGIEETTAEIINSQSTMYEDL